MRKRCAFLILLGGSLSAQLLIAQEYPKAEVYGGYSYVRVGTNFHVDAQNANGWEASVSGNFNKWFAVEGSVGGFYKTYPKVDLGPLGIFDVKVSDYSYAGGPRLNVGPLFIHALFGGDRLAGSISGISASQTGAAGFLGGGVQMKIRPHISVRASVDYGFTHHDLLGVQSFTQNHLRVGGGLVYSFGGPSGNKIPQRRSASRVSKTGTDGMIVPALGLRAVASENGGALIIEVAPSGVAELAGLRIGDVINAIDGKPVRSVMELAAEISGRSSGTQVKLSYMVQGKWQSDTTVVLH